jgi:hypothetical protein
VYVLQHAQGVLSEKRAEMSQGEEELGLAAIDQTLLIFDQEHLERQNAESADCMSQHLRQPVVVLQ